MGKKLKNQFNESQEEKNNISLRGLNKLLKNIELEAFTESHKLNWVYTVSRETRKNLKLLDDFFNGKDL